MRYAIVLLAMLFILLTANAQRNTRAITLEYDTNSNGDYTLIAENTDFCDYHFIPSNKSVLTISKGGIPPRLGRGKTVLMVFDKTTTRLDRSFESYKTLRGNINAKINLDYIYPLPIKSGDSIRFSTRNNSFYTSMFNMKYANDTVYASRAGIVCDNMLTDNSVIANTQKERLIIYHKDGSFAQYESYDSALVHAGSHVEVGQAIAVMKADATRKVLLFSVYFLDKNTVKNESGNPHSAIVPLFHTANKGNTKLEDKTTYIAQCTDELITQEMKKKEKEKYFKQMKDKK